MALAPSAVNHSLPLSKGEAVGAVQSSGINIGQGFLCDKVEHRKRVVTAAAVDRNIGLRAIGRGNDLMRVRSDGKPRDNLQGGRVHNGQRVVVFRERQEASVRGRLSGRWLRQADGQHQCHTGQ